MITLEGKHNTAKVFCDNIEESAIGQIINLLNQEFVKGSKIRIMPDTHAGVGCTIGTTMTIDDKIVPNLVGVDIGCGMETVILKDRHVEPQALDKAIHKYVPAGFEVRKEPHKFCDDIDIESLKCFKEISYERALLSVGTLGGGNHFIEMGKDDSGKLYLVVHSGSRNLGKQVAEYYQNAAYDKLKMLSPQIKDIISELKNAGREKEIEKEIKKVKIPEINKTLAYAEGELFEDYLHDMSIAQEYADLNRKAIIQVIVKEMKLKIEESFSTIHNYIDMDSRILRKGAISAQEGEISLIPINMRDGSLICKGKGNADWNFSAPHGAGRLMSRAQAKESISLSQFKKSMEGIFSSTVKQSTIDESAFAYKPIEEILENITDTVDVLKIIRPIYNFKAAE